MMLEPDLVNHVGRGFIQSFQANDLQNESELVAGLNTIPPTIHPKYFYDALGSKLFEAICELEEYYPTRTECAILEDNRQEIARLIGRAGALIDLGAGNCAKAATLLPFLKPRQYVPVDISVDFLRVAVENLQATHPDIDMLGLGLDFTRELRLPRNVAHERRVFFYPGSSIGNFAPSEALGFLKRIHAACQYGSTIDGSLLIGVDLLKSRAVLDHAYADHLGVTSAFNLNVLRHVNRLIGANFHVDDWRHVAYFDPSHGRVEMHLEARRAVEIAWHGGGRRFESGERILTEYSYKYSREEFVDLLDQAGFALARYWSDADHWFMVCLGRAQ